MNIYTTHQGNISFNIQYYLLWYTLCSLKSKLLSHVWEYKHLIYQGFIEWYGAIVIPQSPWDSVGTSIWDLYQVCTTPGSNLTAQITFNLNLVHPAQTRVPCLGMQTSDISMVVEVVWCHCHTPMPMWWCWYIFWGPIPSMCNYRKQSYGSYHLQSQPLSSTPN